MKKVDKIIFIFYVFLGIGFVSLILYFDDTIERPINVDMVRLPTEKITYSTTVEVPQQKIFQVVADIKNYPKILPDNVISIRIINQTNNVLLAEEEVIELGIRTKLLVKHTFVPYEKHVIEIMEGDAKGTKIIQTFENVSATSTKLTSNIDLRLGGILTPFYFLPKNNLIHAVENVITTFTSYAKEI